MQGLAPCPSTSRSARPHFPAPEASTQAYVLPVLSAWNMWPLDLPRLSPLPFNLTINVTSGCHSVTPVTCHPVGRACRAGGIILDYQTFPS